jgi:hypothetical protein
LGRQSGTEITLDGDDLLKESDIMARKPNYEFERRERARLKAIKNAEKAAAKKEAREHARSQAAMPGDVESEEKA